MSTVDPLEAALGSDASITDPPGTPAAPPENGAGTHPILARYGGDVGKALDAFQELNSAYGRDGHRLGQEVAQLKEQLAAVQQQQEAVPAQQQQNGSGVPDLGIDQLHQWFDEDPAQATAYLVAQGNQILADQFKQMLDERLAPVETSVGQTTASTLVDGLTKAVGADVVERNAQVLIDLRRDDPAFFAGEPAVVFKRMKAAVLAAEHEGGRRGTPQAGEPATPQQGNVAVEGGSSGRTPQTPAPTDVDEFVAALQEPVTERDILGNPKRRT